MSSFDPYLIDGHKMHYHSTRVSAWAQAKSIEEKVQIYPIYVEVSPVGHCNHRCTFCAVDYIGYKTRKIDTAILSSALAEMADRGVKSVMFAGEGEPMLHPDIAELTVGAAKAGLDVAFTTNGTAMTKKFVDNALASTKWIKVSMNGGPNTYGKIHQTKDGDYERVWSNIKYAVEQRDKQNGTTVVGIQCVLLPENQDELEQLVQRAGQEGLNYVVIKPYSQHKKSITHTYEDINYARYLDTINSLKKYGRPGFTVIARTQAMGDWDAGQHSYHKCHATPYFWAYIMATGEVYGCSAYLLDDRFAYGNIHSQSFRQIWTGDKRRASIDYVENKLDISECRLNCRMNQVNKFLNDVVNPNEHANFI